MDAAPGDADASGDTPAAAAAGQTTKPAKGTKPDTAALADPPPIRDPEASVAALPEEEEGRDSDAASDVFRGRPDLSQDALQDLRVKHRELKLQQKRVKKQLKAQERKRSRILKRMRHLDTAAVMQVLMERGVDFQAPSPSSAATALLAVPAGASAGGPSSTSPARPAAA